MRLEPVYLVAPKPKPPSMTRRRALFGMGVCLFAGATIGSACGYSVGAANRREEGAGEAGPPIEPPLTGDRDLDELRRLAVVGSMDELLRLFPAFIREFDERYPSDEYLWRGLHRAAHGLIETKDLPQRRILAGVILQTLEKRQPPANVLFDDVIPGLRSIR